MEITSTPYERTPRENAEARSGLETRWSRPSTMLCAAGSFSSRNRPKPRPSCSANSGVSSFATSPRMSYSRKTCIGMAMTAPLRRSAECTRRATSGQPADGERGQKSNVTAVTLLADEAGIVRVVRVAVVVARARPVSCAGCGWCRIRDQRIHVADTVAEVQSAVSGQRRFGRDARQVRLRVRPRVAFVEPQLVSCCPIISDHFIILRVGSEDRICGDGGRRDLRDGRTESSRRQSVRGVERLERVGACEYATTAYERLRKYIPACSGRCPDGIAEVREISIEAVVAIYLEENVGRWRNRR